MNKQALILSLLALTTAFISSTLFAAIDHRQTVTIGDFLRNDEGRVQIYLTQRAASAACERLGSRLPTARELILDAIKRGMGVALVSTADYYSGKFPSGFEKKDFYPIDEVNPDGSVLSYYFSPSNYRHQDGELGFYWVWSSSQDPNYSYYLYGFNGNNGYVYNSFHDSAYDWYSARCVAR